MYESVQKFGGLITSGKITNGIDVSKVAELLSQSTASYDAYMIAGLINAMLYDTKDKTVERVSPEHVRYVMSQLKATGFLCHKSPLVNICHHIKSHTSGSSNYTH